VRIKDDNTPPFRMNIPIMRSSLIAALFGLAFLTGSRSHPLMAQPSRPSRPVVPAGDARTPPADVSPQRPIPGAQPGKGAQGNQVPVTQTAAQQRSQTTSPANRPSEEFPVTPALEKILRDWEAKSSQIKSLHGEHLRTVYNKVFEEERRASGKFFLKTPDMGRIDIVGTKPKKGEKSARIGESGHPYRLQADQAEKWICTGKEVVNVNDDDKSFEVIPLPEEMQGENIINSPLPFLFGMKADDAKRRFRIKLERETKDGAILVVFPRLDTDLRNYNEAWIILEKVNYLPTAVKMFDPSGNLETVYKFESVKINERAGWGIFQEKDPFHPPLKSQGYKLALHPSEDLKAPQRSAQVDPRFDPLNSRSQNPAPPNNVRPTPGGLKN
jgi:TIGR03009 family protein